MVHVKEKAKDHDLKRLIEVSMHEIQGQSSPCFGIMKMGLVQATLQTLETSIRRGAEVAVTKGVWRKQFVQCRLLVTLKQDRRTCPTYK